ncbi:hypothetical protein [Paenibacillus odorifer]|uniref:hypothetical protein n=1 Tax=Paenibacillus odorifer TaxID=189426 RepID=UPI00096E5C1C|nr:hypothetical protein [Paenibacillus odorifer]OME41406.1 hypothetical protein BSK58_14830 [Paenibacillus odorifer]
MLKSCVMVTNIGTGNGSDRYKGLNVTEFIPDIDEPTEIIKLTTGYVERDISLLKHILKYKDFKDKSVFYSSEVFESVTKAFDLEI